MNKQRSFKGRPPASAGDFYLPPAKGKVYSVREHVLDQCYDDFTWNKLRFGEPKPEPETCPVCGKECVWQNNPAVEPDFWGCATPECNYRQGHALGKARVFKCEVCHRPSYPLKELHNKYFCPDCLEKIRKKIDDIRAAGGTVSSSNIMKVIEEMQKCLQL